MITSKRGVYMKLIKSLSVAAGIVLASSSASAQSSLSVTGSGGFSTGDYGSSRSTTIATSNIGARWSDGSTEITATIPYIAIDTPGVVLVGFDGTPMVMLADAGGRRRTHDGVGDPTFSVSHMFGLGFADLRATGRVKIPVQGFGDVTTGKVDWSVGGELSRKFGNVTPFAAVTYRSYGDPTTWTIRNGFATSVGAVAPVGPGALAVSYDHARSTSYFIDDADEIVGVYDVPLAGSRFRLAGFGTVGLSDGAPGLGGGLRLAYRF